MAQSGKWIADWNKIKKCYVSGGTAVMAGFADGDQLVCGTYNTERQAKVALGMLYFSVAAGDMKFEFPQAGDLPDSRAHYGAGGGSRHGKS